MHNGRNDDQIRKDLKISLQHIVLTDLIVNQKVKTQEVPQDDGDSQISN